MNTVRIWDLPTRLFHWALVAAVAALVVTGHIGGDLIRWHARLGYAVMALLVFRIVWGLIGGRWSRFASFFPTPARLLRYLRGAPTPQDEAGHNPLGAFSVFGLLALLALQVASGLFADDEISFQGPLTGTVSGSMVRFATRYHKNLGQWLLIGLVTLHVCSIIFYWLRGKNLLFPMFSGNKHLPPDQMVEPSADGAGRWLLALVVLALAAALVWWTVNAVPPASMSF